MRSFSELRHTIDVATRAGIDTPRARREVITGLSDPLLNVGFEAHHASSFLTRMEGGSDAVDCRTLVRVAASLKDIEQNIAADPETFLKKGDKILLETIVRRMEDSLYRGNLAQLSEEDSALFAFLMNRVGKIIELQPSEQGIRIDERRFEDLIREVDVFAEHVFSAEAIDESVFHCQERRELIEMQLSSARVEAEQARLQEQAVTEELERVFSFFRPGAYREVFIEKGQSLSRGIEEIDRTFPYPNLLPSLQRVSRFLLRQSEQTQLAQTLLSGGRDACLRALLEQERGRVSPIELEDLTQDLQRTADYIEGYADAHFLPDGNPDPDFTDFRNLAELIRELTENRLPLIQAAKGTIQNRTLKEEQVRQLQAELEALTQPGGEVDRLEQARKISLQEEKTWRELRYGRETALQVYRVSRDRTRRSLLRKNEVPTDIYLF
jgi:hypothetical protein